MVIGCGRRREHPQRTFCTSTTTKKKVRGKKVWGKKRGEKEKKRENGTGKSRGGIEGKSHVTAGDVTSGLACARYHFR